MTTDEDKRYKRTRYAAWRDRSQHSSPYWVVGVPTRWEKREVVEGEDILREHFTKWQAHQLAKALNSVVDRFVQENEIPYFERPMMTRQRKAVSVDEALGARKHFAKWLDWTDIIEAEWTGSAIQEIRRIRDHIVDFLREVGCSVGRDARNQWCFNPPKKD